MTVMIRWMVPAALAAALGLPFAQPTAPMTMNDVAEAYVALVLALGVHDADYVDAYYGPAERRREVEARKPGLAAIEAEAGRLVAALQALPQPEDELVVLRHRYLDRQLRSLAARARQVGGAVLSFDDESRALYDAVAPTHPDAHFQVMLDDLDRRLAGEGTLPERHAAFRSRFVVPADRVPRVFQAAIAACRDRTLQHIELPPAERFSVEYVTGKPWSAYNWYQGGFRSIIQVNVDLPIYIDRAIDLACHEGYPGHHVYNTLLEDRLVRRRGWVEYTVYPLFSPQSLIAEGTANLGIDVAFPADSRVQFERETLFPLAGLDGAGAAEYYEVQAIVDRLGYAGNEAARRYLDGRIDRAAAVAWLGRYALMSPERAAQRVRFFDQYRSYVINYNLGKDLVRRHLEVRGATARRPDRLWDEFEALLSSPRLPTTLQTGH